MNIKLIFYIVLAKKGEFPVSFTGAVTFVTLSKQATATAKKEQVETSLASSPLNELLHKNVSPSKSIYIAHCRSEFTSPPSPNR